MFDRVTNFVYRFVRDLSDVTFCIIMMVLITLGFYCLSRFLKANKKESAKISKISQLLSSIIIIFVFIMLVNIRY